MKEWEKLWTLVSLHLDFLGSAVLRVHGGVIPWSCPAGSGSPSELPGTGTFDGSRRVYSVVGKVTRIRCCWGVSGLGRGDPGTDPQ